MEYKSHDLLINVILINKQLNYGFIFAIDKNESYIDQSASVMTKASM